MSEPAIPRHGLLGGTLLSAASLKVATAVEQAWGVSARPANGDALRETFNGLLAFVVPGNDEYSVRQGVTVTSLGGVDAGAAESLIAALDLAAPGVPQFSAVVAALLDALARSVDGAAAGPFRSPFARLSFAQKAAVFRAMEASEPYRTLAGVLPGFVASFVYLEAGALEPHAPSLIGTPLGWQRA
jgi:hypothetical protein